MANLRGSVLHAYARDLGMQDGREFRGVENEFWLDYGTSSRNDQYRISVVRRSSVRVRST